MTLTLRIENYDVLENGGPPWITIDEKSACVGRGSAMDWILPDPARHISSHHFDISFKGGKYYLTDVSTNGTFLQGQRYRLDGAHEIRSGDRFTVGHYVVGATVVERPKEEPVPRAAPSGQRSMIQQPPTWAPTSGGAGGEDPWDQIGRSATPSYVPRAQPSSQPTPQPEAAPALRQPPISSPPVAQPSGGQPQVAQPPISQPPISQPPVHPATPVPQAAPQPAPPPVAQPAFSQPPAQTHQTHAAATPQPAPQQPIAPSVPPVPPQAAPQPVAMPKPEAAPVPVSPGPAPAPVPPPSQAMPGAAPRAASNDEVFRAFCEGAGIDPAAYADADVLKLAAELGRTMRIATGEVMTMLQDRAAVKHFTRGGERTMRSASGNNPMKFLPDTEQAVEAMFLRPRDGFMQGADGFENALHDIRQHQGAVFAALQPALAQLLSGMSPEEVAEASGGGGIMGGGKSKSWEVFVERWDAKAQAGDNGMLDAFLEAFSKSYAEAIGRSSNS